jgi:cytochrome c-type biogenesis protein CcmH
MILWLLLTLMTSLAAVLISAPFIRRSERRRSASDLPVYQDQLKEVEIEAAQGFIDPAQAESASMEIKRRILAADRPIDTSSRPLTHEERNFALVAVTGIVVLGSVGLYALTGRPELAGSTPGQDGQPRRDISRDLSALLNPSMTSQAPSPAAQGQTRPPGELGSVDEMIQRLVARLQRNPKDREGWRTLGWSYFSTERYDEAVDAYAKAIELNPTSAEYRSARIEALVHAANGTVTADARSAIEDTLKIDPKNVRARYYLGLAKEQAGDKAAALKDWTEVLADADPGEPLLPDLKKRVAALGGNTGATTASSNIATSPKGPSSGLLETLKAQERSQSSAPVAKGPTPDDIRNAEAMTTSDRTAMIRTMVDGLASRLEKSPRDVDGWIKLIRSRVVLGETDAAKQSLDRALKVFARNDDAERSRIIDAAQQLGITP